jgi:hypothetical protein
MISLLQSLQDAQISLKCEVPKMPKVKDDNHFVIDRIP